MNTFKKCVEVELDRELLGLRFVTALHVMQTWYTDENSVRLSVRPSFCLSVNHTRGW